MSDTKASHDRSSATGGTETSAKDSAKEAAKDAAGSAKDTAESAKDTAESAKDTGEAVARKADSPWLKTLGEVGVAAIGVVYLLLAWIALQVAFGGSDQPADNSGALREIAETPFGPVLLAVMGAGLFCYALWQLLEAVVGYAGEGKERTVKRLGAAGRAAVGAGLMSQSFSLAFGRGSESSGEKHEDWTATLLGAPGGRVVVVLAGLGMIAFAGFLVYAGVTKKFLEKIEGGASRALVVLGQVGWIARGVAFGVLGALIVVAGVRSQPDKARGLDAALKTLAAQPYGAWLLTAVAIGFAAYGTFQLVTARRRREG